MYTEPINVTDEAFEKVVLQASLPVVVDFWAPWCGHCRRLSPLIDKLASSFASELVVAKVNVDEYTEWARHYGVNGIPTLIFLHNGKELDRQVGALSEEALMERTRKFLEKTKQA